MIEKEKGLRFFLTRLKRPIIVLLAAFALFAAVIIGYSKKVEPMVSERIRETIATSTDSLYTIRFSNIRLNPFTGTVRIDDIVFVPNYAVYQKMLKKGVQPTHLFTVAVKSLALEHIHPFKVYFKRGLDLKSLHINHPTVRVSYLFPRDDDAEPEDKRTTWQRLSKYLHSIKIEEILLNNIDFQYTDKSLNKPEIDGVKNFSVRIQDLLIDSASQFDTSRFYHSRELSVQVRKHSYLTRNGLYTVLFDDLRLSSRGKYALVKGLKVIPRYSPMEFSRHLITRQSRYEVNIPYASLNNIDFKRLIDQRQLRAASLNVQHAHFNIFLDTQTERPKTDRGIDFPQLALKRMRLNTVIDTINIINAQLNYGEYTPLTARTGRLSLNELNAKIYNFTNDSLTIEKKPWLQSKFSTALFGKANFNFALNFNLSSASSVYNYIGELSEISARHFNQLSRPMALLRINSGKINQLTFSVKGDYRTSTGFMKMRYQHLNIGLLSIDSNKVIHKQMLRSMVANNILLKEDNPMQGEAFRVGKIGFTRPDSVAFFGNIWQSLYSGLRETIGLTPERENALKAQFQSIKSNDPERDKKRGVRRERRKTRTSEKP